MLPKNKITTKMNVLSLFDGMSCGQYSAIEAGLKIENYFAYEIDKFAIKVAKDNYANTIHLGSVVGARFIDLPKIDLLIGGSPCQGFSFAGKGLNFEDPRSKLFFEFLRAKKETNPKYFLLENVKMKKAFKDKITELMGIEPIEINSSLVSAQNRPRLYWTNIPGITQPEDLGLYLRDILEDNVDEKFFLSDKMMEGFKRRYEGKEYGFNFTIGDPNKKTRTIVSRYGKDGKECLIQVGSIDSKFEARGRVYSSEGKSPALTAVCGGHQEVKIEHKNRFRKLTPIECERLQTLPTNYTSAVSNSQRYRMIGNGWTAAVITHIFKNIPQ